MKYFSIVLIILFSWGCTKENNNNPKTPYIIKQLTHSNGDTRHFEYYSDGRVRLDSSLSNTWGFRSLIYTYDPDTMFVFNTNSGSTYKYYKISETQSRKDIISDPPLLYPEHKIYGFTGGDCGYTSSSNTDGHWEEIDYLDEFCSYKIRRGNSYYTFSNIDYYRDYKHSWSTSLQTEFSRMGEVGNIIIIKEYNFDWNSTTYYNYEYNSDNYPISRNSDDEYIYYEYF